MVKGSSSGANPFNGKKFSSDVKKEIVEAILKDPRGAKVERKKEEENERKKERNNFSI